MVSSIHPTTAIINQVVIEIMTNRAAQYREIRTIAQQREKCPILGTDGQWNGPSPYQQFLGSQF